MLVFDALYVVACTGRLLAVVMYKIVVPAGKAITKRSSLPRVSGRVKEKVSPPKKLLTPIGVTSDELIRYCPNVAGCKPLMYPAEASIGFKVPSLVVTVSESAGSVVGGANRPPRAMVIVYPAAMLREKGE